MDFNNISFFLTLSLCSVRICRAGLTLAAIRNISLHVVPPAIRRGQHATLRCNYDLEGEPLYSVKFYRGMHEFYRYSPSEVPVGKIFPFPGIQVDVSLIRGTDC